MNESYGDQLATVLFFVAAFAFAGAFVLLLFFQSWLFAIAAIVSGGLCYFASGVYAERALDAREGDGGDE